MITIEQHASLAYRGLYAPKNPSYREVIAKKLEGQELMKRLDLSLTHIEPGYAEASNLLKKMHLQQDGYLHGGLTGALADIVSGFAAYTLVEPGERVVTADIRTSYFRPGVGTAVHALGWVVKPGKNFFFCEAEIFIERHEKTILIAKSSSTMAVVRPG